MIGPSTPDELRAELDRLGSLAAIAREYGVSTSTIASRASNWGIRSTNTSRREVHPEDSLPPLVPIEEEELRIEGDASLSSDWHLPIIDWEVYYRWLDDSQKANLSTGVCAGDMFNFDAWSRHDQPQKGTSAGDDMDAGKYAVSAALDVFDRLVVTRGNHDENLHRKLDYGVRFNRVMRMALEGLPQEKLDRLVVTGRDYVIIDTDEGEWRVAHTRSYSRQPLAYPNRVSMRYEQHVAAGHRHHHAQGWSSAGRRIVELGGFMDEERMAYTKRYTNDFPMMNKGYALLIDGKAHCPMLSA